jgi:hypothetical protein
MEMGERQEEEVEQKQEPEAFVHGILSDLNGIMVSCYMGNWEKNLMMRLATIWTRSSKMMHGENLWRRPSTTSTNSIFKCNKRP